MKLEGDLSQLSGPPEWDFYCDNILDARGPEAHLTIYHPGSYKVQAIVCEKSGNVILVERHLMFPPNGVLGYEPWDPGYLAVSEASQTLPTQMTTLRSVSINSVASPSAYGYTASNVLGSALYVNPPADFHDTPLKEV